MADDERTVYNLKLTKVVRGKSDPMNLQMSVTKPESKTGQCYLNAVDIGYISSAETLQIELCSYGFWTNGSEREDGWRLQEPQTVKSANGEVMAYLRRLEFKLRESGQYMAYVELGEDSDTLVTTENFKSP